MPERRREQRKARRTPRRNAAWIVLSSAAPRIPCVLWDISDSGARIAAARASTLPPIFCLLPGNDTKSRRFCRVVWRKGGQVGVRFIEEAAADMDLDSAVRYPRYRSLPTSPSPQKAAPPSELTAEDLVLPGCGPRIAVKAEPRGFVVSSVALGIVLLLAAASALLIFAGVQSAADAPWALEVCDRAENFCRHPEWTVTAAVVMTVVYFAVKGMEL
jgi:hypothetical protein